MRVLKLTTTVIYFQQGHIYSNRAITSNSATPWAEHRQIITKTKLHICYICAGGLRPAHVCSLVVCSDSGDTQVSRLLDSIDFSYGVPIMFESTVLVSTLPQDFQSSCLMFGFGSLYLFQSAAGWRLSEDSYAMPLPTCIT